MFKNLVILPCNVPLFEKNYISGCSISQCCLYICQKKTLRLAKSISHIQQADELHPQRYKLLTEILLGYVGNIYMSIWKCNTN